ncbi:uncharacterized protein LOC119307266 [Triticum dicoccoides]|uniref:uncharacterized protein LOC119307266 n=1 Tax=Triticum dicoccoides TaxID=85692 RepID=UPI00188E125D|nr:uncharacterized protein LOC119307266 [Triticum dicoccoides]
MEPQLRRLPAPRRSALQRLASQPCFPSWMPNKLAGVLAPSATSRTRAPASRPPLRRLESSGARAKSRRRALVPVVARAIPVEQAPATPQPSSSRRSSPRVRTSPRPCPRTTRSASSSHLPDMSPVRFTVVAPCIAVVCRDLLCFVHAPILPEENEQRSPCSIRWHALTAPTLKATSALRPNCGLLSGPAPVSVC